MGSREKGDSRFGFITLAYAAFVVYGSLVPLAFRPRPLGHTWDAFFNLPYLQLGIHSRADWVANILLYIPLAFFLSGWLSARLRPAAATMAALLTCMGLAVGVEFAQLFFPPRTVSKNDLIAEALGTGLGIALWHYAGIRLLALWDDVQHGGRQGTRALIALYTGAYLAFALFPYDFVISASELTQKLAGAGRPALLLGASCGGALACGSKLITEILVVVPLGVFFGLVVGRSARPSLWRAFGWGLVLGLVIEGLQTFLASGAAQGVSIVTRALGMAAGLAVYRLLRREWLIEYRAHIKVVAFFALPLYAVLLLALNGFFSSRMHSLEGALAKLREVRFLPFYYHYFTTETQAVHSLLIHAGAYAPVGLAVWILASRKSERATLWMAATAAFLVASGMEALKLFLVGKKPDPTDALIAAAAATLACFAAQRLAHRNERKVEKLSATRRVRIQGKAKRRAQLAFAGAVVLAALALAGWVVGMQPRERFVEESRLPKLAPPEQLPAVQLPTFRTVHPRLPYPTPAEADILRRYNPGLVQRLAGNAEGGKGNFYNVILLETLVPGSIDVALLHRRLIALEYFDRGHDQVKPLAMAYDWLYARWSEPQRALLRAKLVRGCEYLINYIREERLSPYNVILYNAPLQALMACAIAVYRDDPRGEPIMAFTHDLWKNRVLPVWRQVMGKNGGWHEGGEYVGIGIGQAIYQLPAMWRQATGEDYIAAESGIRGFLDFVVYRTRPDGTHFRWGDGAYFDRAVPDATPLALELRHAAAYTLQRPPEAPTPSSWPWGPLTDATLLDPEATKKLPLTKHFDGIGMVVMRSDWSADATYVTFKAGDNFWSHSHLDQGAFTIYKGGPLAIDSGQYGPGYGTDHHMNYSYQTIAHNAITVTDPGDTAPAPGKDEPRPIANDGGQRRIGSGWGVEAAPIDRAEWEAKRDIYHTGKIERLLEKDGITVVISDITPAYTNAQSGRGTFSHRTRRVERARRTMGYDRVNDVVVIFDHVLSSDASFQKRWLLHSIEQPRASSGGFSVNLRPDQGRKHPGGVLEAKILLPKAAVINAVGGESFEFLVDGKNYEVPIAKTNERRQNDRGAWRVEVSGRQQAAEDFFLVVLLPSRTQAPAPQIELIEVSNRLGCEITMRGKTTRWLFERIGNGMDLRFPMAQRMIRSTH